MKQLTSMILSFVMLISLCACGSDSKEVLYQEFVALVDSEKYEEAINFWLEEYDKSTTGSYEDFKADYFTYKEFADYFNYASALENYIGTDCKSLTTCLRYLKKVSPGFLDRDKYVQEIENLLKAFQGIYESSIDGIDGAFRYIIIRNEQIWFANGFSIFDLGRADIVNSGVILENHMSVDEFCAEESSWDIYIKDGKYMAGNSLVKNESDCIFGFSLNEIGTQMTAIATGSRYTMFSGSYTKIQ